MNLVILPKLNDPFGSKAVLRHADLDLLYS